ncbi:MAG: MBL fold metallo-hydrolase [Clostridia bacterium]|nr:MBL fold metallo-hydrolase [Clostridia bacterium]
MYELVQVGKNSFYINSPAKIGVYKQSENEVYLIDSGNDKDAGRKIRKILDENGWNLKGIINTHSNADHIGGNRYLQQQYNCRVFSAGIEKAFTEHTLLEPSFLYGGYPFKELRHKFLQAEESVVTDFSDESFPKELEIIPLPGHFFDMVGIRTPDNTVFLADCISSKSTLEKYQLAFIYDVKSYLDTLDMVERLSADIFVPSHAEAEKDLSELIDFNRKKIYEIADSILSICSQPSNFEEILKQLFDRYCLTMSFEQYVLVGSTLRSYLSWLKDSDKLKASFGGNYLNWLHN